MRLSQVRLREIAKKEGLRSSLPALKEVEGDVAVWIKAVKIAGMDKDLRTVLIRHIMMARHGCIEPYIIDNTSAATDAGSCSASANESAKSSALLPGFNVPSILSLPRETVVRERASKRPHQENETASGERSKRRKEISEITMAQPTEVIAFDSQPQMTSSPSMESAAISQRQSDRIQQRAQRQRAGARSLMSRYQL